MVGKFAYKRKSMPSKEGNVFHCLHYHLWQVVNPFPHVYRRSLLFVSSQAKSQGHATAPSPLSIHQNSTDMTPGLQRQNCKFSLHCPIIPKKDLITKKTKSNIYIGNDQKASQDFNTSTECGILRVRQPAQRAFERKRKGARIVFFLPFQTPARKATSIECPFSPGMKTLLCFAGAHMRSRFYLENHPFPHSVLNYRMMDCHAHSSDRKKNSLSGYENSPLQCFSRSCSASSIVQQNLRWDTTTPCLVLPTN